MVPAMVPTSDIKDPHVKEAVPTTQASTAFKHSMRPWDGKDAPMSAHVVTATKP